MYSKLTELSGLALIALGAATLIGVGAGLLVGGAALLLIGGTTDDAQVTLALRRAGAWMRFYWHRQLLRESIAQHERTSPHPPLYVDPEAEAMAARLAAERIRRGSGKLEQGVP